MTNEADPGSKERPNALLRGLKHAPYPPGEVPGPYAGT